MVVSVSVDHPANGHDQGRVLSLPVSTGANFCSHLFMRTKVLTDGLAEFEHSRMRTLVIIDCFEHRC